MPERPVLDVSDRQRSALRDRNQNSLQTYDEDDRLEPSALTVGCTPGVMHNLFARFKGNRREYKNDKKVSDERGAENPLASLRKRCPPLTLKRQPGSFSNLRLGVVDGLVRPERPGEPVDVDRPVENLGERPRIDKDGEEMWARQQAEIANAKEAEGEESPPSCSINPKWLLDCEDGPPCITFAHPLPSPPPPAPPKISHLSTSISPLLAKHTLAPSPSKEILLRGLPSLPHEGSASKPNGET